MYGNFEGFSNSAALAERAFLSDGRLTLPPQHCRLDRRKRMPCKNGLKVFILKGARNPEALQLFESGKAPVEKLEGAW